MRIGIGLPNTVPGCDGSALLDWARLADAGPFDAVAVLDRLRYDSIEPFAALAAAAAVTSRVRLATMIAIGPLRTPAALAKQALSVQALSGGRLTLGLGIGARLDDYAAAEVDHRTRGAALSRQLAYLRGPVAESGVGPAAPFGAPGIPLLVGGTSGSALARMARYGDGYAHGGGPPRAFASAAAKARAAWQDLGRAGEPLLWGQAYLAIGDPDAGRDYLRDYYAFTGPFADKIAAGALTSVRAVRDVIRGYAEAGCDELVLFPTSADAGDLNRIAEVVDGGSA
ncbi:LLM class flavin-dependent oxidoreductase [Actinokineospora auranticolor]|uniref:Alkanesulfonate monooxygenase SsuD/methylene tetrahydromethanopterin reductase-like flavin-dependent oxidoreductase (Luciferase family) n=1 Tax=Actinokineospora auranticolor TaxID=155976 RepID=A0A2S6GEF8_9PSEU|nr:LLM class flavin-dependent oxidoreductase [Actinokineospora auranticolor]PPK63602.1 alkanesulfonate monooxygenase SsuD/methylene tetrahydromethanopterin reductase-like flavin-dependent oxidoreductase (luciferase family) [Actinokineospora auranticolor]